jgi:hypothetical protein
VAASTSAVYMCLNSIVVAVTVKSIAKVSIQCNVQH